MNTAKQAIAVIGDLVNSKQIEDRYAFQELLAKNLAHIGGDSLDSPYTLTLGDEFQALYAVPTGLFYDLFQIRSFIYPVQCRFSIALGEITTPINTKQAIGMDGPAFHLARKGIDTLKKNEQQLTIAGLPDSLGELLLPMVHLLWASTGSWNVNRLKILLQELEHSAMRNGEYNLEITERAINKNIKEAHLHEWVRLIDAAENQLKQLLIK